MVGRRRQRPTAGCPNLPAWQRRRKNSLWLVQLRRHQRSIAGNSEIAGLAATSTTYRGVPEIASPATVTSDHRVPEIEGSATATVTADRWVPEIAVRQRRRRRSIAGNWKWQVRRQRQHDTCHCDVSQALFSHPRLFK